MTRGSFLPLLIIRRNALLLPTRGVKSSKKQITARQSAKESRKCIKIRSKKEFEPVSLSKSFIAPDQRSLYSRARLAPTFRPVADLRESMSQIRSTTPNGKPPPQAAAIGSMKPWIMVNNMYVENILGGGPAMQHISFARAYTPSSKARAHRTNPKPSKKQKGPLIDSAYHIPLTRETLYSNLVRPTGGNKPAPRPASRNNGRVEAGATFDAYLNNMMSAKGCRAKLVIPLNNIRTLEPAPSQRHKGLTRSKMSRLEGWGRNLEASVNDGSVGKNNKSTLFVRGGTEEKADSFSDEERQTVVENDCENDYSLLCNSVENKYR